MAVSEAAARIRGESSAIVTLPDEPVTYRPNLFGTILAVIVLVGFTVFAGVATFRWPEGEEWVVSLLCGAGLSIFASGLAVDKITIEPGRVRVRRTFKSRSFEAGNSKVYVETELQRGGPGHSAHGPRYLNLRIEQMSPRVGTAVNVDRFRRRNKILIIAQIATALDTPIEGIEQIDESFLPASRGLSMQDLSSLRLSRLDSVAQEPGRAAEQDHAVRRPTTDPPSDSDPSGTGRSDTGRSGAVTREGIVQGAIMQGAITRRLNSHDAARDASLDE